MYTKTIEKDNEIKKKNLRKRNKDKEINQKRNKEKEINQKKKKRIHFIKNK